MDMAKGDNETLTVEQEMQLRQPIEDYVSEIQKKVDSLRADGTNRIVALQNSIDATERDRSLMKKERENRIAANSAEMEEVKAAEAKNKDEIVKLISETESYLKEHFDKNYYLLLKESCEWEKAFAREKYSTKVAELNKEHEDIPSEPTDHREIEDGKYIHKGRLFDARMDPNKELQRIKDGKHVVFVWQYYLIDVFHLSKLTFMETKVQKRENYKHTFNRRTFLLQNGLYIATILISIGLCIVAPVMKNAKLLTYSNISNILRQVSPRMFLALSITGLILLTDTDLSIGRMVGMGVTTATVIMHQGINTGAVFGHAFDFTGMPIRLRVVFAFIICIILCTCFTAIGGFFTAKLKMHPFISTMANMLVIFGLVTHATKGVSFNAIEPVIPKMIIPKINGFPIIILRAVAAIVTVWFIWDKTTFGKDSYTVGGNPEAAAVSGVSVLGVTMGASILAGILYGFGSWLECAGIVGSGSAAYDQGWEMGVIAACAVGGVSFIGGIGKISGVVVGVLIFTVLIYSLTILGIDTDLRFVFKGIIIIATVTLGCPKYVQKK